MFCNVRKSINRHKRILSSKKAFGFSGKLFVREIKNVKQWYLRKRENNKGKVTRSVAGKISPKPITNFSA
jgi:hypothetical protein